MSDAQTLWGTAERAGIVQSGEDKTQERPCFSLQLRGSWSELGGVSIFSYVTGDRTRG